jgi:hypothetical protein
MKNKLISNFKRRLKKAAMPVISSILALAIVVSGLPLFPGDHISRAFASTINVEAAPPSFNTVYNGGTTLSWNYEERTHETTVETCSIAPRPPLRLVRRLRDHLHCLE